MGLFWTVVLGALVGWVASLLMKRDAQQGVVGNILVGVVGAVLGTLLYSLLTGNGFTLDAMIVLDLGDVLVALVGACLLLAALNYRESGRLR